MAEEVSEKRLYLGNLPPAATKKDVEDHFKTYGTLLEVKIMNGFGFVEFKEPMDARDAVPSRHGEMFMGNRLTVQFARGSRPRDGFAPVDRNVPRPRRTSHRMQISGLPAETSWQDLKDFARSSGLDVVYTETGRERDGRGVAEFESAADLRTAVEKLDGREFKGERVTCVAESQEDRRNDRYGRGSRSPRNGSRYNDAPQPYYNEPRGSRGPYPPSPRSRHAGYRERDPPPRSGGYGHYDRERYSPGPPRRRPEDYPPPRSGRYDDYDRGRRYNDEPYTNGHGYPAGYERRSVSPRGRRTPPRDHYDYGRRGGGGY